MNRFFVLTMLNSSGPVYPYLLGTAFDSHTSALLR
jgi:hypothetical protein